MSAADKVRIGLETIRARSDEIRASWRHPGKVAREAGLGVEANPNAPGSFSWECWLEGWGGTRAPSKPERRAAWLERLGVAA